MTEESQRGRTYWTRTYSTVERILLKMARPTKTSFVQCTSNRECTVLATVVLIAKVVSKLSVCLQSFVFFYWSVQCTVPPSFHFELATKNRVQKIESKDVVHPADFLQPSRSNSVVCTVCDMRWFERRYLLVCCSAVGDAGLIA